MSKDIKDMTPEERHMCSMMLRIYSGLPTEKLINGQWVKVTTKVFNPRYKHREYVPSEVERLRAKIRELEVELINQRGLLKAYKELALSLG